MTAPLFAFSCFCASVSYRRWRVVVDGGEDAIDEPREGACGFVRGEVPHTDQPLVGRKVPQDVEQRGGHRALAIAPSRGRRRDGAFQRVAPTLVDRDERRTLGRADALAD